MTVDQLNAAWAEYDRRDAVWLVSIVMAKRALQGRAEDFKSAHEDEVRAHSAATVAWSAARAIGPRPAR